MNSLPWQVAEDCGDSGALAVYDSQGRKLALVFGREIPAGPGRDADRLRAEGEQTAQARARLIAAAPDLLAALKEAHGFVLARLDPEDEGEDWLINLLETAIAKARE